MTCWCFSASALLIFSALIIINANAQLPKTIKRSDSVPHRLSAKFGNSSEVLHLLLDVNSDETWIFADKSDKLFTFKDLCKADSFNRSYSRELDGFDATFDGYYFKEHFVVVKNQQSTNENLEGKTKIGFVFRSTLNETVNFSDGIFGLGLIVSNENGEEQEITIATNRNQRQSHLIFGQTNKEKHCADSTLHEETVPQLSTPPQKWIFSLKNLTFGNNSDNNSFPQSSTINQTALISSLNPSIVGPKHVVHWLYQELETQQTNESIWPQVNCSMILNAPDLEFYSERILHRITPSVYVRKMDQTCHLLILPLSQQQQQNQWILGQPFFIGRCLTFDYSRKKIGFADGF